MDNSNENSNFVLFYKHENDGKWEEVVLKNFWKRYNSTEYRFEYTIPNIQAGRYIFQIQSKSNSGIIQKTEEAYAYKAVEVSPFLFRETVQECLDIFTLYCLLKQKIVILGISLTHI